MSEEVKEAEEQTAEAGADAEEAAEAGETAAAEETAEAEEPAAEETPEAEEEPAAAADVEEEPEEEPVHELSRPPVIDVRNLLQPISGDNPSGEYLRYSGIYDEISEARREDDTLGQEDWGGDVKVAEYGKVIDLAVPVIEQESKDLQISAWLAEALVIEHGFAGLRDSLKLVAGLQNKFWETLYPEIDEGDEEGRANALAWMDQATAFALRKAPITAGAGYGLMDYEDSKRFNIPDDIDSLGEEEKKKYQALEAQAEKENRATKKLWRAAVAGSNRAFYEELHIAVEECLAAYEKLVAVTDEKFDPNQVPSLNNLKKTLEDIRQMKDKLLEKKREEEPDPADELAGDDEAAGNGDGSGRSAGGGYSVSGAIQSRREALRRLSEIARFFSQTEPHSPVSHLVNRAVRWGEMPLEAVLRELIKDENVLGQIRETLGLNGNPSEDDASAGEESGESSSDDDW